MTSTEAKTHTQPQSNSYQVTVASWLMNLINRRTPSPLRHLPHSIVSTNKGSDEESHLDVVQLGEHDEDNIYVFYPTDATDKNLETMWIRSSENGTTWVIDQQ